MLQFIYDLWEKTVNGCITYLSTLSFPPWFDTVGENLAPILNSINFFFPVSTALGVAKWLLVFTINAMLIKKYLPKK